MSYILEYFDELIEIQTIEYYRGNKGALQRGDISEEISMERDKIEKKLRDTYYSPYYEENDNFYFEKILGRVMYLLRNVERNINTCKRSYASDNRSFICTEYQNYHSIYNSLYGIYQMLTIEFKIKASGQITYPIERKTKNQLYEDYTKIRNAVLNDEIIPEDLISFYEIDESQLRNLKDDLNDQWPTQEDLVKERIGFGNNSSKNDFKCFYKSYLIHYVRNGKPEYRFFYIFIKDKLKEDVSTLKSKEEKLLYIEDFFLHTDLCADLVFDYFEEKIERIQYNDENVEKEFKNLENRLIFIKENPRHRKYHASRLMEVQEGNVDLVLELLEDYKKSLGMDTDEIGTLAQAVESSQSSNTEPKQIKLLETDGRKYLSEKIEYNGTADSLGLLFALFFESGLIKSKNQKARVARILSVSFNAGGDSFSHDTILKAFKEPLSNQKSVKYLST